MVGVAFVNSLRVFQDVMPRLERQAELDVLLWREPDEVGEGCAFEEPRLPGRGPL